MPPMLTFGLKIPKGDLEKLRAFADSVGTSAPQLVREAIRLVLALEGELPEEDTERILRRWKVKRV